MSHGNDMKIRRTQRRRDERTHLSLQLYISRQIDKYYAFVETCRDVELQSKKLSQLNGQYKAWIRRHPKSFDYQTFENIFFDKILGIMNMTVRLEDHHLDAIKKTGDEE